MNCKNCGAPLSADADYCLHCGQNLPAPHAPGKAPVPWMRFFAGPIAFVLLALVIWVAVCISEFAYNITDPVAFSQGVKEGIPVYADIISIDPEYGIYSELATNGRRYKYYYANLVSVGYAPFYTAAGRNCSSIVCKCETSDGDIVWVTLSETEYEELLAPAQKQESGEQPSWDLNAVSFPTPVRIYGKSRDADDKAADLADAIGAELLILLKSVEQ